MTKVSKKGLTLRVLPLHVCTQQSQQYMHAYIEMRCGIWLYEANRFELARHTTRINVLYLIILYIYVYIDCVYAPSYVFGHWQQPLFVMPAPSTLSPNSQPGSQKPFIDTLETQWYTDVGNKKNLPQSHMWECKTLLLQSTHSAKRVNLHHLLNSMKHYIQHIILLSFQYYVVLLAPHENFVGGVKTRSKRKSHISWWVEIEHFFSLSEKVCVSMQFILLLLLLFSRSRFIHTNNRFTHGNQINP